MKTLKNVIIRHFHKMVALFALLLLVGCTPMASAVTQQNCFNHTGPTNGHWSTTVPYAPGGWCMQEAGGSHRLVWQTDGNLVVYSGTTSTAPAVWSTGTYNVGTRLAFQSDGNMVIYNGSGVAIWATNGNTKAVAGLLRYELDWGVDPLTLYRYIYEKEVLTNGSSKDLWQSTEFN